MSAIQVVVRTSRVRGYGARLDVEGRSRIPPYLRGSSSPHAPDLGLPEHPRCCFLVRHGERVGEKPHAKQEPMGRLTNTNHVEPLTHNQIATRAYAIWLAKGGGDGHR